MESEDEELYRFGIRNGKKVFTVVLKGKTDRKVSAVGALVTFGQFSVEDPKNQL